MNNNSKKWFDLLIGCKITQISQKQRRNVTFLISFNIEKVFFIQILSLFFTTCLKSDFSSRYMSGMENRNWSNSLALPFFPISLVSRRLRMLVTFDLSKPISTAIPEGDMPAKTNWQTLYSLVFR